MHEYGDGFPYFDDVEDAAYYIGNYCRKWGRIPIYTTKEKYGTARVYVNFGYPSIHSLMYPGRYYKTGWWPQWLWSFDIWYGSKLLRLVGKPLYQWQKYVYKVAYRSAVRKYPHIKPEIVNGADYPELL